MCIKFTVGKFSSYVKFHMRTQNNNNNNNKMYYDLWAVLELLQIMILVKAKAKFTAWYVF